MRKFVAYNQEVRIYKGIDELGEFKNSVVTIGTFDGVHKGHQKILSRLNKLADEISGESILLLLPSSKNGSFSG